MTRQLVAATSALPRDAKIVDVDTAARRLWTVLGDERTVVVTDTTSGEEVGRRTFDGFRWPERFGEHLVLQGADGGFAVAPADLSKNAEWLLREGRLLRGVGAGVAHITVEEKEAHGDSIRFRFGRVAVDLASRSVLRQTEETAGSWQVPDPERDLALNVVGGRIDAYRSTSGEALFSVEPFEGTPINAIDGAMLLGERLHVRASTIDEHGRSARVVMLDRGGRPHLLEPLLARAEAAGVSLPAAIVALVARVEESEPLRSALADAGFFFAETDLGLDTPRGPRRGGGDGVRSDLGERLRRRDRRRDSASGGARHRPPPRARRRRGGAGHRLGDPQEARGLRRQRGDAGARGADAP